MGIQGGVSAYGTQGSFPEALVEEFFAWLAQGLFEFSGLPPSFPVCLPASTPVG
ncbi:Hypothetical protein SMAX5B_019447 [Scophthalmus maximus]|uniref:Uncharacterized protein n=1 Tax=Scophthalmus maximus TaxID=52904 RepID=A0A2U9BZD1_SCOMX|nr:Hypothetical protein SMAX5B_019447 [Scophthalmus maximus]